MRRARATFGALIAVIACGTLAGCSPVGGGYSALAKSNDGTPWAIVVQCRGWTQEVELHWRIDMLGKGRGSGDLAHDITWSWSPDGRVREAALPLTGNAPGWHQVEGPAIAAGFAPAGRYTLWGHSRTLTDGYQTIHGPQFDAAGFSALRPGHVLSGSPMVPDGATIEEFAAHACDDFGQGGYPVTTSPSPTERR